METININCPECGLSIDYWTTRDYFKCPKCKHAIVVKMSQRNLESEGIIHPEYAFNGEDEVLYGYSDNGGDIIDPTDLGDGDAGVYVDGEFVSPDEKRQDVSFILNEGNEDD